jgi:hypothetical protein
MFWRTGVFESALCDNLIPIAVYTYLSPLTEGGDVVGASLPV